jgi:hypothetical protein
MSEHDAASVVGQQAGLTGAAPTPDPVTPEQLAERFGHAAAELVGDRRGHYRDDEFRFDRWRGFCGYMGGRGDSLIVGFDDGYSFMGYLEERGWRAIPSKGDWPYLVYLYWPGTDASPKPAIVEYCEADFSLWVFDDRDAMKALARTLRNEGE